jgi:hypothetical protein
VIRWLGELQQDVFRLDPDSLTDVPSDLESPMPERFWPGPSQHRVGFEGTLAEWSTDGVGWLAEFLADICQHSGIRTPVVLTVQRSD